MPQQFISLDALRLPRYYVNGPFVLDGMESAAYINGRQLNLTEDEYNALYLLAEREGFHIPFTRLYKAVWETFDGSDRCGEAREGLKNINRQLHKIKNNGPYIGYNVLKGFTLRTGLKKSKLKFFAFAAVIAVCLIFFSALNLVKPVSPVNAVSFINERTPLGGMESDATGAETPERNAADTPRIQGGRRNGIKPCDRINRNGVFTTF